jgi:hypothetical protein
MGTTPSTIASHTTSCAGAHLSSARCSSTAATLAKWNSQQDLLNPLQKTEVVSNHDKHDVSRYRSLAGLANLPNSGSDLEEILPRELWELTLSFCCDRQLAVDIPLTCKYFYGLCNEDCAIWKQKSIAKFNLTVEEILSLDTTWKRHYHCNRMKLFPLEGCTVGKSTLEDFQKVSHVKVHSTAFLSLDRMSCWIENGLFSELYLIRSINRIPKNWESDVGISWHQSFNEYKLLLKKWTGNYTITLKPHQQISRDGKFFAAKICSVAKEFNIFYEISFEFGPVRGSVDSQHTLNNIRVRLPKHALQREEFVLRFRSQLIAE